MEIVIIALLTFAGIIGNDMHFDNNKAQECADKHVYYVNDLEKDYCLAVGKIEQGEAELAQFENELEELGKLGK